MYLCISSLSFSLPLSTLRVHGGAKDSSFSGPKSRWSVLLFCCTMGADAAAAQLVQMPSQESADGSGK